MKEVNRREFLKVVGTGVGAAALASVPMGLLNGAGPWADGGATAFSFAAEGPLPAGARPTIASLVLRGHVTEGRGGSGFLNQRIVAGYPATSKAEVLPHMGLTGRVDRVHNGAAVEIWGTVDDAVDRRLLQGGTFHLTIDRSRGTVDYRLRGRSHRLRLKEFESH